MTDDQFKKLLEVVSSGFGKLTAKMETLAQVTAQLKNGLELKLAMETPAPDYEKRLADYANFDWSSIDAEVLSRDDSGPTVVEWRGRQFPRRNGNPRFGLAIIYSRAVGRDPNTDKVKYEWLISFKEEKEVEELPGRTQKRLNEASRKPAFDSNGNGSNDGHQSNTSGAQFARRSEASAAIPESAPPSTASTPPASCTLFWSIQRGNNIDRGVAMKLVEQYGEDWKSACEVLLKKVRR